MQLFSLLDQLLKETHSNKEQETCEEVLDIPSKFLYKSLKRDLKHLDKEILGIETRLLELIKQDQQVQLTLLKNIPGIGIKTALFLIVITDGFSKFETSITAL